MKPSGSGYIPALDGLRAVSIALVLLAHLAQDIPEVRAVALASGQIGVSVFFVVSGYLITMLLLREEAKTGGVDLRAFYIRRALRIFPASYFFQAVIITLALAGLVHAPPHDYIASALYVRNLVGRGHETAHLWSLSLEEQFYMFWPFLFWWLRPSRRLGVALGICGGVLVWRALLVELGNTTRTALLWRTDLRVDTILMGCVLALVLHRAPGLVRERAPWLARGWVFWGAWVALFIWETLAPGSWAALHVEMSVVAVLIAVIVLWTLSRPDSAVTRLFQTKPFRMVGRLSYSLYLWQQLFLGPQTRELGAIRTFPLDIVLTVVAAVGSYLLIERPFLRLKDRFAERTPARGAQAFQL